MSPQLPTQQYVTQTTGIQRKPKVQVFNELITKVETEIRTQMTASDQLAVRTNPAVAAKAKSLIKQIIDTQEMQFAANPSMGEWPTSSLPSNKLEDRIFRLLYQLGPINLLLQDPKVEDIAINGASEIFVRTSVGWEIAPAHIMEDMTGDNERFLSMLNNAISASGQQAGPSRPIIDERLPDGSRVSILTDPVAADGVWPVVVIRRHRTKSFTAHDFVAKPVQTFDPPPHKITDYFQQWNPKALLTPSAILFLQMAVISGLNIAILGRTGVGKTAFISMLGQHIPSDRRVLVLEDTRELKLREGATPQNCVYMTTIPKRMEGSLKVEMYNLIVAALRQRPDHLVLGEARGAEMWDLLNAMQTGQNGNLTSVHAISADEIVRRVEYMIALPPANMRLTREQIAGLIGSTFHVAIKLDLIRGRRFVDRISVFTGSTIVQGGEPLPETQTLFQGGKKNNFVLKMMAANSVVEDELDFHGFDFGDVVRLGEKEKIHLQRDASQGTGG